MIIYEAIAEDRTHLGGPMGSEYTTDITIGLFTLQEDAKKACQGHYNKSQKKELKWHQWTNGLKQKIISTDDLGSVKYHVVPKNVK